MVEGRPPLPRTFHKLMIRELVMRVPATLALMGLAMVLGGTGAHGQPAQPVAAGSPIQPEPNTTGPVTRPMIASIGPDTYLINEFGAGSIYLVVGTRRALVIDSGSGFFDLKALIESLTSLPYDVAITHSHADHAGGIGQFDAVYMNAADADAARKVTYEQRVNYGRIMRNMGPMKVGRSTSYPGSVWAYSDASVRHWAKVPEIKPIADRQVFDLGERKVTAYAMPNHTPGSMMFIDDRSRILFSGDAANSNTGANAAVSTALRGMLRLKSLRGLYDRQFTGHAGYATTVDILPQDPGVIGDLIEVYRSILRGNPELEVVPFFLDRSQTRTQAVYGAAHVTFNPEKLWEPGEAHVVP